MTSALIPDVLPGAAPDAGSAVRSWPRVLHVDADSAASLMLSTLLAPEVRVTSVASLDAARTLLRTEEFALVVLDPGAEDSEAATLVPLLRNARLLVYAAAAPSWHAAPGPYLAKPWTSGRQLWTAVAGMLGIPHQMKAGD